MLKMSRLMLASLLWFGACVQAAEAEPTKQESVTQALAVFGYTELPPKEILEKRYQELMLAYEVLHRAPQDVAQYAVPGFTAADVWFVMNAYTKYQQEQIAMVYCNELLSRFYRSQLDAMAKAAPESMERLKEAIAVACKQIDQIGAGLIDIVEKGDIHKVQQEINTLRAAHTLQIALNSVNKSGDNVLLVACLYGYVGIVQELLSLKKPGTDELLVDVNATDNRGKTVLMEACLNGNVGIVQELLSLKKPGTDELLVDVNATNNRGETALVSACRGGNVGVVQELLSLKDTSGKLLVDVSAKNKAGWTALTVVCYQEQFSIVQLLLEHGANILPQDNKGESALKILRAKLADAGVTAADKVQIRLILSVFDALKPDLTNAKLKDMLPEARLLKDAYEEFQEGNHQELRNVLFEVPLAYTKGMGRADYMSNTMVVALQQVFKSESIRPLFMFLINSQKEQTLANVYLGALGLPLINLPSLQPKAAPTSAPKAAPKASADTVINMDEVD